MRASMLWPVGALLVWMPGCAGPRPVAVPPHYPTTRASTTNVGKELLVVDFAPAQYHPIHYEYIMPEEQQRRVLEQANQLKVGDSVDDVVARLGPPLRDEVLAPKVSRVPTGRALAYYFAKRELMGANLYDPCVDIFFDSQNRITNAYSNVPGIANLNWPPAPTSRSTTSH